jgi:hypothetical protein
MERIFKLFLNIASRPDVKLITPHWRRIQECSSRLEQHPTHAPKIELESKLGIGSKPRQCGVPNRELETSKDNYPMDGRALSSRLRFLSSEGTHVPGLTRDVVFGPELSLEPEPVTNIRCITPRLVHHRHRIRFPKASLLTPTPQSTERQTMVSKIVSSGRNRRPLVLLPPDPSRSGAFTQSKLLGKV